MKPKSDTDLLPVLLKRIGSSNSVSKWPTQMKKSQRTEHARETQQARAAQDDRPPSPAAPVTQPAPALAPAGRDAWPPRGTAITAACTS
jgi:hypothetical protein